MLRTIQVAHKTLDAIDTSMRTDQGASYRQWLGKVIPHMDDAYRGEESGHRTHMGASIIGGECPRAIWYSFHWATKQVHDGKTLRLFNRGHLEEARFIALLLSIGVGVWQQDENGKQFRISGSCGHFGGSGDGKGAQIPDLPPTTMAVLEFKTHGEKSFIDLAGKLTDWRAYRENPRLPFPGQGVRAAKFEHFVQMQTYMRRMGLAAALYMAVCKNTDDLYAEIITLDSEIADQFLNRADNLIWMGTPPKRINESPGFFKCRFCNHRPVCHTNAAPNVNCRTCKHSAPCRNTETGKWGCLLYGCVLDKALQQTGCGSYERDPVV